MAFTAHASAKTMVRANAAIKTFDFTVSSLVFLMFLLGMSDESSPYLLLSEAGKERLREFHPSRLHREHSGLNLTE
jgi:hypothetical protein